MKTLSKIISKALLVFIVILSFFQVTNAQEKSWLWKISGNGLNEPSYLYGSLHALCPDDLIITDATKDAIENTEQMAMEIDLEDPQLAAKMGQLTRNPENKNISDQFAKEDVEVVNQFLQKHYNTDLSQLGVLKPFAMMSLMLPKVMSCPQPASYEKTFIELKGDKELLGLETIEEHIGQFDQIPAEEQFGWVADFAKDPEAQIEMLNKMLALYKANDLYGFYDQTTSTPQFSEFADVLLYKRNADWIGKIAKLIQDKPTFISVGAGHLASDRGVIELLRKEGYEVTAVN